MNSLKKIDSVSGKIVIKSSWKNELENEPEKYFNEIVFIHSFFSDVER